MTHAGKGRRFDFGEFTYGFLYRFIIVTVLALTLYPLVVVLSSSVSNPVEVGQGNIILLPKGFTLDAYRNVMKNKDIWTGYMNTIIYTVFGTVFSMLFTVTCAYALSKRRLRGRGLFLFLFSFTMWFDGGIIPTYLIVNGLGLINNRWVMILPGLVNAYYMILMRSYFESIPDALEESAKIDGANDITILTRIFLPLSLPSLVTIGLYYAVLKWNAWFHAMLYLKDEAKYPLQLFLRRILTQARLTEEEMFQIKTGTSISAETIQYATIVVAVIPMLVLYPFVQKYFAKGVMLGSVKG